MRHQQKQAILTVTNIGPALPDQMNEQIFESIVSIRPQTASSKPHLGLGLYIARLVSDFHHGTIKATNVVMKITDQVNTEPKLTKIKLSCTANESIHANGV